MGEGFTSWTAPRSRCPTPRSTGSNNFTGGTTLQSGILRVGDDARLGGPNTQLTLSGGLLEITGGALTLDNRNVNWSAFNGGFYIDDGVTFTINVNVPSGVQLNKQGPGTMNIAGNYNVGKGVVLDAGTISVAAGASLSAGLTQDWLNSGYSGSIVVGSPGTNLPTTLAVTGGYNNAPDWTDYMKLGGGGGNGTIVVYGNNNRHQCQ